MIKVVLLLGLFVVVNSSCGPTCSCPPLQSLNDRRDENEPLPPADCDPNMICTGSGYFIFYWSDSDIPLPIDADLEQLPDVLVQKKTIDFVDEFGVICQNGSWYVTKYPGRVHYFTTKDVPSEMEVPERDDGTYYKTKIYYLAC